VSSVPSNSALGRLADPNELHEPIELSGLDPEALLEKLALMKVIRASEERIGDLVTAGEARCPCHLAIGQEACAVGVAAALDSRDRIFGAHRSHAHYLAVGGDVDELFAEVLGKATGCSGGMGGSMHLVAPERGLLGTVPIVGATIPLAVGAGLVAHAEGKGGLAVSFFGDGATEEGIFHESMNLARVRNLPVLFVCENNLFSSHLHIRLRQPADRVSRYAEAHLVAYECIDGNDLVQVMAAAHRAADRAREGGGPTFLELVTYRWRGHVGPREDLDVGVLRDQELPLWKKRDPIARLKAALVTAGIGADRIAALDADVARWIGAAIDRARMAPYPEPSATARYMYAAGHA
jgi:TPP-dependent pyruvate/acetoin dehydrogenase alpha subunit